MENVPKNLESLANEVVQSYREGKPVVVHAKDGGVLHGEETIRAIVDTGVPLDVLLIKNIDRQQFEGSDLPEICEAARQVWLEDNFPKD